MISLLILIENWFIDYERDLISEIINKNNQETEEEYE